MVSCFQHSNPNSPFFLILSGGLITPLPIHWAMKVALFVAAFAIIGTATMDHGPTQNWLVRWKGWLENRHR